MQVFSRKKDEEIVINNNIEVVVVEIRGYKVGLGIMAPREVCVHRQEVYDMIQQEKFRASLDKKDYEDAYEIFSKKRYDPTIEEADVLKNGLQESGQLTDAMKSYFDSYKQGEKHV